MRYVLMLRIIRNCIVASLVLAGALLLSPAWTGQAWAQDKLARVGILSFFPVTDGLSKEWWMDLFPRNLADRGWIEGKTVSFEYRSANGDPSRFVKAATELAALEVDVIIASSAPALQAAYAATQTIPIVAIDWTTDPVAAGYIQSYARPGGNVTGVFLDAPELAGKWFGLLQLMIPDLSRVAVLWDPAPGANVQQAVRNVAKSLGLKLQVFEVRKPQDIDQAFSDMRGRPQAVILLPSPMIHGESARLAKLALQYRLPAASMDPSFPHAGGMLSYGPEPVSANARFAGLAAKILNGRKPAEIPVERPTEFRLLVNQKAAEALGITVPQSVLLSADEVIR